MRREVFIEKITLQLNACGKFKRNVISVIHNLVSWNADLGQILSLRRQNPKVDFIRWLFTFSYSYMLLFERCWIVDTHTKNKHRHHHHQLGIIMSLKLFFWLTSVTICCIVSISAIQPLPTGESSAKANTVCKFVERNQLKIMTLLQRIVFFVDSLCVSFQCLWAIIHLFLHSFCFCCIFFFICSIWLIELRHCKNLYTSKSERPEFVELSSQNMTNLLLEFYVIGTSDCHVHLSPIGNPVQTNYDGLYDFRKWNTIQLSRSLPPSLNFQPRARACQIVLLLPLVPPTLLIFTFRQLSFQVIGGFNNSRTVVRHGRKILRDFRTENVLSESQPVQIRIETAPSKRSN